MTGYRVGEPHPTAGRRQWHDITDGEVADLADAVVRAQAAELRRLHVAGGDLAPTWALATAIRETITRHHQAAFRRWLVQRLEAQHG